MSKYQYPAYPENATEDQIKATDKQRRYFIGQAQTDLIEQAQFLLKSEEESTVFDSSALKDAVEFLTAKRPRAPRKSKGPNGKKSREEIVLEIFNNADNLNADGQIDELGLFSASKALGQPLGRAEAIGALKKALDVAVPDQRVWVSFNSAEGVYTLEGRGANPPTGWKGKLPAPKMVDDESAVGPGH